MEIREIALVVAAALFFMLMLADHYFFEKRIKEVEDRFIKYRTDIHNKMSNILDSNENILEHSNRCISLCNDMMFQIEKLKEHNESGIVLNDQCIRLPVSLQNIIKKGEEVDDREGTGE